MTQIDGGRREPEAVDAAARGRDRGTPRPLSRDRARTTRRAVAVAGAVLLLTGCFGGGDQVPVASGVTDEVPSPSGGHVAGLEAGPAQDGAETLLVVIKDDTGAEVFRAAEPDSTGPGVAVAWQSSGEVLWVLSSDVGTSRIEASTVGWEQTFRTPETREDEPPEIDALR